MCRQRDHCPILSDDSLSHAVILFLTPSYKVKLIALTTALRKIETLPLLPPYESGGTYDIPLYILLEIQLKSHTIFFR
jgi:hypothetical protein